MVCIGVITLTQTASAASPAPSSYETLSLQDSVTSNWIITSLASEPQFEAFAKSETESILARDAEDDEKREKHADESR